MSACGACGEPCLETDVFCNNCGYPLHCETSCKECKYPLPKEWKFCAKCGADSLPAGWKAASDETGAVYYVDEYNEKSQWDIPTEPVANLPEELKPKPRVRTKKDKKKKKKKEKEGEEEKDDSKEKTGEKTAESPKKRKKAGRSGMTFIDQDFAAITSQAKATLKSGMKPMSDEDLQKYSLINLVTEKFRLQTAGGLLSKSKPIDPQVLVAYEPYKKRDSWGCFLKINDKDRKEGEKIWRWVASCMMERKSSKHKKQIIEELSRYCATKKSSIRDEIYCVLMKQLNQNKGAMGSKAAGWQLMDAMLRRFPPSNDLQYYLQAYLQVTANNTTSGNQVQKFVTWCQQSLSNVWGLGHFTLVEYSLSYYDYITKYKTIGTEPIPAEELLCWGTSLQQPLQKLKADLRKPSKALFSAINKGVKKANPGEAAIKISKILNGFSQRRELVDEAYCLCLKQCTFPKKPSITVLVCEIMNMLLEDWLPSPRFGQYMHTQVLLNSKSSNTPDAAKPILVQCLQKLAKANE